MKNIAIAALFAFGLGGLSAYALLAPSLPQWDHSRPNGSAWTETQWPFPIDEWGVGKGFRCGAEACGTEVKLYIRPKIGFCNCTTGVSDDDELDRLSDFRLMGYRPAVLGSGHPITVSWMNGRSRPYAVDHSAKAGQSALAIAFNDHCDAIVATAVIAGNQPMTLEPYVLAFLNSRTIIAWTQTALGR
jgi:hypothetical protein